MNSDNVMYVHLGPCITAIGLSKFLLVPKEIGRNNGLVGQLPFSSLVNPFIGFDFLPHTALFLF